MCTELDWLLDDGRWQRVGPGYSRINDFLATVNLAAVDMSSARRQSIIRKLDDLGATQRPMAAALGVGKGTIHRSLNPESAPSGAPAPARMGLTWTAARRVPHPGHRRSAAARPRK